MLDPQQLSPKQQQFLQQVQQHQTIASLRAHCLTQQFDFNFIKGLLLSGVLDEYVRYQDLIEETWQLTEKGQALQGQIPGAALAAKLLIGEVDLAQLQAKLAETFSIEFGALRKAQAVVLKTEASHKTIEILNPEILASYAERQQCFEAIAQASVDNPAGLALDGTFSNNREGDLDWLSQQNYIVLAKHEDYALTALPSLAQLKIVSQVTTLTSELILSQRWQAVELKPYNIQDEVPDIPYSRPTILTQCIQQIRDIFLNMGFDEMSGYLLESAFWNFDVLFTPQDHPAREVQDTFYLSQPQTVALPNDPILIQQVQQVHEQSYGGQWSTAEASQAILRAHTTSSTARKLYALQGQDGKYFSIDKVFRNETPDRTHLAEFHQIEGVVIGELLSVRTLMGYLSDFYNRLGFKQLKFKPTYNPYTEPSLEVYAYHAPSDRYLEVGNSGLFRREMLAPLGCQRKATIAWGLGLERIAMLLYNVEKLADLVGPDIHLQPTQEML